jgi:hypothetical protein
MDSQWRPRRPLSIFIHALHLLDLDLLPDFPGITESTFGNTPSSLSSSAATGTATVHPSSQPAATSRPASNQTQHLHLRIKRVEWALYRLFEIYDADDTHTRLGALFPPATPLQSLNLRTALYKMLTDLKKNGVLPRDTMLRKSMLDECKGDKFEQLLGDVGMAVLREKLQTRKSHPRGGANTHGSKHSLIANASAGRHHVVPLILAHRVSLQQSLQKRQTLKSQAGAHAVEMAEQQEDILRRLQIASSQPDEHAEVSGQEYQVLNDQILHAFAFDRRWAEYIFHGNPEATTDPTNAHSDLVQQPMDQLLALISKSQGRVRWMEGLRDTLLSDTRVAGTSSLQTSGLVAKGVETTVPTSARVGVAGPRFNRHQALTPSSFRH